MTNPEPENGKTRDELVRRLDLMEAMIAEGRRYTGCNSWIFVLWGVVDLVAHAWQQYFRHFGGRWAWPICLSAGCAPDFCRTRCCNGETRGTARMLSAAG